MEIYRYDQIWQLVEIPCKGWKIDLSWIYVNNIISSTDLEIILDVLAEYAKHKAASTAVGINTNIKPFFKKGIVTLDNLKYIWEGMKVNQKKGINQFFHTCKKLGYETYKEHHDWTSARLPKTSNKNIYSQTKGALSETEYRSLISAINKRVSLEINESHDVESVILDDDSFSKLRNAIAMKLLLSVVRRPIQLMQMKWGDIQLTTGFSDAMNIQEPKSLKENNGMLKVRIFRAKITGGNTQFRYQPEKFSIHIHESFSHEIMLYKQLLFNKLKASFSMSEIVFSKDMLVELTQYFPVFPSNETFKIRYNTIDEFKLLFTDKSVFGHAAENTITAGFKYIKIVSDRVAKCTVGNNRIRHTILTRGAQDGYSLAQLAKMTGVTVPAVRGYVDMDFKARKIIDENFIGNEFLERVFNSPTEKPSKYAVIDDSFNYVGNIIKVKNCQGCRSSLGKPVGCYGCPNFIPILEADHRSILMLAKFKLKANTEGFTTPLKYRFVEKLQEQIKRIEMTINVCDQMIIKKRALENE
ncbi:hypothetical protein [Zobellella taiwanensis]